MGLFNRSGPVVLRSGYGRRKPLVPTWLWLLATGIAIGAAGLHVGERAYGPPRLTPSEAKALVEARDLATREAAATEARLTGERDAAREQLAATRAELAQVRSEAQKKADTYAHSTEIIDRLTRELALFEEVLPPDPRGNPVGVRAARLERAADKLAYHVLLTREEQRGAPFTGMMQLVVNGKRAGGATDSVTLGPVPVKVGSYQHLKGTLALPKGFEARQTTIQVLDKPDGKHYGMRIIGVQ